MKKVLIITSYYPPIGGPGCIKLVKHLKYMKNSDWEPVILTQKFNFFFAFDETLMSYVEGIPVYRFFSPDIGWLRNLFSKKDQDQEDRRWLATKEKTILLRRIQRFIWRHLMIPDGKIGWALPLFFKALGVIKKENIDLVYVRLPVWSMGISAALLSKFIKKPVIIDFDDEWIGFSHYYTYTKFRQWVERRIERWIVKSVDIVISTAPRVRDRFIRRFPKINPEKFRYITMGFDPDDFENLKPEPPPIEIENDKKPFIMSYLGTFHEDIEPEGYFITPYYTYQALQIIEKKRPDILEDFRFVIIGHLFERLIKLAKEMNVYKYMHITGFLPHKTAMNYAAGSDLLLFVLYSKGRGNRQLPAKLYEYIAMGKPILSLVPESDGADIIRETKTGIITPPENAQKIAEAIIDTYDKMQNGNLDIEFDKERIDNYRQNKKTRQLTTLFDEAIEKGRGFYKK
ncbi:MAG: glycosyltransferase [Candidatus Zixiibacteriota bacterium]